MNAKEGLALLLPKVKGGDGYGRGVEEMVRDTL